MSDLYKLKKAPPGSPKKWQVKVRSKSGGVKTVSFGARGYEDYTQHKDKARRDNYRSRHRGDRIKDPTSSGFWSWHVLWGDSTSVAKNLAAVKRKFRLNPADEDAMQRYSRSAEDIQKIRESHKNSNHFEPNPSEPWEYEEYEEEEYLARRNAEKRFPRATVVQSLVFDKDFFTKASARTWAKSHGFRSTGVDETLNTFRIRQHSPDDFTRGTFRTVTMTEGVMGVVGMPRRGVDL